VLNGTCNFVLDRCAEGATLHEAVAEATREGFAEPDPSDDLSGHDAARKLRILSRHAFGGDSQEVELEWLDERIAGLAQDVVRTGMRLRQVGRATRCDGKVRSTVRFEEVPVDSPFGRLRGEWNALEITSEDGALPAVTGRGAGRWPTTEAVMADLFDVHRKDDGQRS
jgi:homoserine dehydrogenase